MGCDGENFDFGEALLRHGVRFDLFFDAVLFDSKYKTQFRVMDVMKVIILLRQGKADNKEARRLRQGEGYAAKAGGLSWDQGRRVVGWVR